MQAVRGTHVLLERDRELTELDSLLTEARRGEARLVVVEGSAGIGKTRLLAAARDIAERNGFSVMAARGGELESAFAFGVVRQLLEPSLTRADSETRAEWLSGAASFAAGLFGAPGGAASMNSEFSFAMLHGLYWLTANMTSSQPTLLVVDDVHWCDEPSLRWLAYLTRRLEGLRLIVLVATRSLEQAVHRSVLAEMAADPQAIAMRLMGLGQGSAAALAFQQLGTEPDPLFAAALWHASGGNPLYLSALLATVKHKGVAPTAEEAPNLLQIGPEAVSRDVALRLARLPSHAVELLQAAAILGDGSPLDRVAALTSVPGTAALVACAALMSAGLLSSEDPVEFRHPIVRTAVLAHMPASVRLPGYRRAATMLTERGAPAEHAAAYLLDTLPEGDPFTVGVLRRAAAHSVARGATDSAVRYLTRALVEPPARHDRVEVLYELGSAELRTAAARAADHLLEAIDLLPDDAARPDIVLSYMQALILLGRQGDAVDLIRRTGEGVRARDPDLYRLLTARLIQISLFDPELQSVVVELQEARDAQDSGLGLGADTLAAAWALHGATRGSSRAQALRDATRALASGGLASGSERFYVIHAAFALTVCGETAAAGSAFDAALASARSGGDLLVTAGLELFRGHLRWQCGDLLRAEEDLRRPEWLPADEALLQQPYRAAFLGEVLLERGEIDEATRLAATPVALAQQGHRIYPLQARGRALLLGGNPDEALAHFLAVGQICGSLGIENPAYVPWRSQAALTLRALDRGAEAIKLAHEELALAERWGAPRSIGVSLHALALLKPPPSRLELLSRAVEVFAASAARLEHARALVDLGAALRRDNRRREARPHLREGVDLASRCGAPPLAARGNAELAATGARPRSLMLTSRDELTVSERRVAELAASGMSNRDIAQTLFVTVKTVELHLSRSYRKLDISSRRELDEKLLAPTAAT